MKKRRSAVPTLERYETSTTGHHCPRTGWWSAGPNSGRFVTLGEVMPALSGSPAVWILAEAAALLPSL